MSLQCWLDQEQRCCCTCKHRVNDWSHPHTDGLRISIRRGFICANPELGHYSGWDEHGLCEVWAPRPDSIKRSESEWFDNRYGERTAPEVGESHGA